MGSMFASGESSLDNILARYSERDETLQDSEVQEMLVQTALVQRAVAFTENFAERRGFLTRIEEMLERADLPIRAGEAIFFVAFGVLGVFGVTTFVSGSAFVAAILSLITAGLSYAGLQFAAVCRGRRARCRSADSRRPAAASDGIAARWQRTKHRPGQVR